jgi:predicted oxidoreductase
MERLKLSNSLELSRIVYGMWRVADASDTSPEHVQAKIEACLAQGITSIDQADIYGDYGAEQVLGQCFKRAPHLRDQVEIITKCDIVAPVGRYSDKRVKHYDTSPAHIQNSVAASLRLMQIDRIDLLLIHRPDPFMDHEKTGKALDDLIQSGKIAAAGVSNFKPHDWTLLSSAMQNPLVTNQIEMSVTANQAFTNGDLAFLQERSVRPMAWSPLGGGTLFSDKSSPLYLGLSVLANEYQVEISSVAVAWLLAHPALIMPVVGTNNIDRINKISEATSVKMDRETWFELYSLANGCDVP